jgi:hypothetical protein
MVMLMMVMLVLRRMTKIVCWYEMNLRVKPQYDSNRMSQHYRHHPMVVSDWFFFAIWLWVGTGIPKVLYCGRPTDFSAPSWWLWQYTMSMHGLVSRSCLTLSVVGQPRSAMGLIVRQWCLSYPVMNRVTSNRYLTSPSDISHNWLCHYRLPQVHDCFLSAYRSPYPLDDHMVCSNLKAAVVVVA